MTRSQSTLDEWPTLSDDDEIDIVCDKFEIELQSGNAPDLGDFLNRIDRNLQNRLFRELVLLELAYADSADERLRDEYVRRYPKFLEQIETIALEEGFTNIAKTQHYRSHVATGERLGHFELIEKIGSGAAGEVWKAKDARLRRIVALKIPIDRHLSEESKRRFLREGQAAAQLQHPNIVAVHEVGREGGIPFISSQYIPGGNLRDWHDRQRRTLREVATICAEIAEALNHAHDFGIVHRDLKPANILVDQHDRPHITDFGLAKWIGDAQGATLHGQLLGTPAYMSPEQAQGDSKSIDSRTDIYALGVILYEMLTGLLPFTGSQANVLHDIVYQDPVPPHVTRKDISRDLETICLKAMEKDRSRRYTSAQELAVDLRRFVRGELIYARRAGAIEKSWRWISRRRALAGIAVSSCAAAGLLATVVLLSRQNRELLGLRWVTLRTNPPDAKVAFVPLSSTTGEPVRSETVFGRTGRGEPNRAQLKPGDYLVVAVMEDGRFHEVFRRVPRPDESTTHAAYDVVWHRARDGSIELSEIEIPPADVTNGMVYLPGSPQFEVGADAGNEVPGHRINVRPFYVDLFSSLSLLLERSGALSQPAIIVAASGNESERPRFEIAVAPPAAGDGLISVGALQRSAAGNLTVAAFSNTQCNLSGPGVSVTSAWIGGADTLKTISGTSMATPHVAGCAALWAQQLKAMGGFTSENLAAKTLATSKFIPGGSFEDVGNGIVQAPQS